MTPASAYVRCDMPALRSHGQKHFYAERAVVRAPRTRSSQPGAAPQPPVIVAGPQLCLARFHPVFILAHAGPEGAGVRGQPVFGTLGVSLGVRRPILSPSQTSGSYLRPTTRSFIGISALSVILMCSGQTSVQHLVMLQ